MAREPRASCIALTADVTTVDLAKCRVVGMNDYIAKPVDERLLYTKIVALVKSNIPSPALSATINKKYIDLAYLTSRTKSNQALMVEMINLYLEQTPPLVSMMKQSFQEKDWVALSAAVHKMIPSFSIVGIHADFENMAKKVQEYASMQSLADEIEDLILQLEDVCVRACHELEAELITIKNKKA